MFTYSEKLAEFAGNLQFDNLPVTVVADVKFRIADTLGICLMTTSLMKYAESVARAAREMWGKGSCTVVGRGSDWPMASAAFVNAALAHGIDFDDVHGPAIMHASSVAVPGCLAVGEKFRVSGQQLIVAMTICYEVLIRMGLVAPQQFHARGIQATGMCGSFAMALAAGRLSGLNVSQLASAVGQCGAFLTGLRANADEGAWSKQIFPGWGIYGGIMAVALAKENFLAPRAILENRWGFYNAILGLEKCDLSQLECGLNSVWQTPQISFKPYPTSGRLQSMIECALQLRKDYGIVADDVEDIEMMIGDETARRWFYPPEVKAVPPTTYAARFSAPYVVAAAIAEGKVGMSEFTEEKIHDPRILRLAGKVRHTLVEEVYPFGRPAWIRVRMRNGKSYECQVPIEPGNPKNPLPHEEVAKKFFANAEHSIHREKAENIWETIMHLDTVEDITTLLALVA